MVDIMSLRQLYKQQKITKVKQIYRYYNLANFMIKAKALTTLKTLIDTNHISINTTKLVK